MKKINISVITFALSIFFACNVYANLVFTINIHQTKDKQDSDKKIAKEESEYAMSVVIGNDYFSYTSKGTQYIYDFTNKRVFTVDLTSKKFSDDSLFSDIGFRTYEFQNRLMLGGALEAGGVEDNPMLPVFSEHLFSLQQKDKKSELSQTTKDNFLFFSAAGRDLLSYSRQGMEVSREDKEMFIKFFRYVFGGHPQILEQFSSNNIIPKSIRVQRYDVFNENNELSLSEIATTPPKPFSLDGYRPGVLADDTDPFSNFLSDIKYSKSINLKNHLESLLSRAKSYFQNGNYIDTMLCYLEYNLSSSLPLPPVFQEQRSILNRDENVKKLIAALSPKSKEEAEKFLIILQELKGKAKYQGHVIKIFEANTQIGLGNLAEAKNLFYEALRTSPLITGAYKDLGSLYFNEYNAVLAWRCWDIARKIAPEHKMLSQINEFETRLSRDYPEFF